MRLVLGALALLVVTGAVQGIAWTQGGGAAGHLAAPRPQGQNPSGMHVYIWAGLKTHSAGQHDYPQFLADWSKTLTDHGAIVVGGLHPPTAADLEHADVVVIYKGDAGYLSDGEKAALEAFVKRGGGLVSLHDSLCGPDPLYFSKLVGGAKKHGEVNYTLDGVKGLNAEGGSARVAAATELVESLGGKIESFYFAFGDTDVYVIVDMPDDVSVASAALTVSGGGGVTVRTVVLLTAADLDAATKKTATYRPPGR